MKKPAVIAIIGSKSSGKTTTIEALTRELTKRGYKVAAVKHIPEPNFTMDTVGKDTWRFAKAGAKTIISVTSNEIATIEKTEGNFTLDEILQKCRKHNFVLIEGFRNLVSKNSAVPKIVTVKSAEEVLEAQRIFNPIIAFTGPYSPKNLKLEIPYIDVLKNPEKIADIAEAAAKKCF
ncbi:MAG: molybdopterin-guanine dinucleotide biosynthesis protein B [Candidatus Bathyarchaeia archaeon]